MSDREYWINLAHQLALVKLGTLPDVLDRGAAVLAAMDGDGEFQVCHVAEAAQYYRDHVQLGLLIEYAPGAPAIARARAAIEAMTVQQPKGE